MAGAISIDDAQLDDLAASLADQLALLYGARPGDPTAGLSGNTLAFTCQEGLSGSDYLLLKAGRGRQVREFRESFLRVVSHQLIEIVSALSDTRVAFFFAAFDPASRITTCSFVLEANGDPQLERRRAIRNWSEQVQRNARDLRARHARIREEHTRLRESLERTHDTNPR